MAEHKICFETINNPYELEKLLNEMQDQIVNLCAKIDADSGDTSGDNDYESTIITVTQTQ